MQRDPNATAALLLVSAQSGRSAFSRSPSSFDVGQHYGDGLSPYAYLQSSPNNRLDAMGTFSYTDMGVSMGIQGIIQGLVQGTINSVVNGGSGSAFGSGFAKGFIGGALGGAAGGIVNSAFAASATGLFGQVAGNIAVGVADGAVSGFASGFMEGGWNQAWHDMMWGAAVGGATGGLADGLFRGFKYARGACFVEGTVVATPDGPVAIQHLRIGDLVVDVVDEQIEGTSDQDSLEVGEDVDADACSSDGHEFVTDDICTGLREAA
jgi:hypothetical protein